jgi:hypothetical protein
MSPIDLHLIETANIINNLDFLHYLFMSAIKHSTRTMDVVTNASGISSRDSQHNDTQHTEIQHKNK